MNLSRALQLKPGEARTIALLFGWYFCVIGGTFVGRAVRDSLFLAHLGAGKLPIMYIATPLVVTIVGVVYARIESRWRRDSIAVATVASGAIVFVAARFLLESGNWIFYALYIASSVIGSLVIMQLWTVASDRFTARDAKRVFGLIGAGGTAADIAIGAAIAVLAPRLGTENLLFVVGGLFALAAMFATIARRGSRMEVRARVIAAAETNVPGTSHLKLVGVAVVLAVVVVTLVEFQFKAVTASVFGSDREGMVEYFGWMSVGTGVVSLIIQVIATRGILHRLGVAGALLVLPIALGLGEIGLLIVPGLVAATILKAGDETFRFTVNDAASQLVFVPVPSRVRGRWKAIVDGAWKPGAQLALGLVLLGYRAIAPGQIAPLVVIGLVVIAIWISALVKLRQAYVTALGQTLRAWPDTGVVTVEEMVTLRATLKRGSPIELAAALALVGDAAYELVPAIAPLCAHADRDVRRAAIEALFDVPGEAAERVLHASLNDPEPELADLAAAALLGRDPEAAFYAAALVRGGSAERVRYAVICGRAHKHASTLAELTADQDPLVARAAVHALGESRTAEAIDALLGLLDREVTTERARAFARAAHMLGPDRIAKVRALIDRELIAAYRDLAAAEELAHVESYARADGTREPPPFLRADPDAVAKLVTASLRERQELHRTHVLALLAALEPRVAVIEANLRETVAARRANAIEVLDAALPRDLRARVIPLVDDAPRYAKLAAARSVYDIPELDRAGWVEELTRGDSWIAVCVAYYAKAHGIPVGDDRADMMTIVERVLLLKGVELFAAVPSDELARIARIADERRIEAGATVLRENDPGDSLYFVVEGSAIVTKDGRRIAELGERGVFGELALLDPGPRSATVQAATDLVLLEIKRDAFVEILAARPEVPLGVIRMLARRVREAIA
ncbi:MAG: cyclic nucleotide-binding domain-containing protein [Kofleriaceae bacterium]